MDAAAKHFRRKGNPERPNCVYNGGGRASAGRTPMSSGIATPSPISPQTPVVVAAPPTECELLIDDRLRQTRRQVKMIDLPRASSRPWPSGCLPICLRPLWWING